MRWRAFWPMWLGMLVAGAAAVVASAATLAALARAAGWVSWTPWLLPAALDVAGAVGGWCWLRPGAPRSARRFGRCVAIIGAAGTLVGNGAGHLVASRYLVPGPVLVVVVGAVPAAVLVALAHLTALLAAGGVTDVTLAVSGVEHAAGPIATTDSPPELDVRPDGPSPVQGPRKLPTNPDPGDGLEVAARAVAERLRTAGHPVSRARLAAGLREAGHAVGTQRAAALTRLVAAEGAA